MAHEALPLVPAALSSVLGYQTPNLSVEFMFSPIFMSLHILVPLPRVPTLPFSTLRTPIHELINQDCCQTSPLP